MQIVKHEISKESVATIELADGNIIVSESLDTEGVSGVAKIHLNGDYFFDKLKEAIPGQIDDAVIEVLKMAIKSIT